MNALVLVLISGKRGAGKDYLASRIREKLGSERCGVVHFADALKLDFAEATGLDFDRLLTDRAYKEQHRVQMTEFYKERFAQDPLHYPRIAFEHCVRTARTQLHSSELPHVILLPDYRQPLDGQYFREQAAQFSSVSSSTSSSSSSTAAERAMCRVLTVRLEASEEDRQQWGWRPNPAVDNDATETGLDDVAFDLVVYNRAGVSLDISPVLEAIAQTARPR